jgi:hypothetical protein
MRSGFRSFLIPLALAGALGAMGAANAQSFAFGWNPRTGDMWVDTQLSDINRYGTRYRDPFIDEIVRYHGAPRDLVSDLLLRRHWAPGDVYFACALAQIIGRPCRVVADEWERNHGMGWGALAQRYGIKPGSAEFHRLKRGFVPTYDRWARPIELDDALRADFPGRGKGAQGKGAQGKGKPASHGNGQGGSPGKGHGKPQDAGKGHGNGGHGKPQGRSGGHGRGKG